jgi:hypothetical protein
MLLRLIVRATERSKPVASQAANSLWIRSLMTGATNCSRLRGMITPRGFRKRFFASASVSIMCSSKAKLPSVSDTTTSTFGGSTISVEWQGMRWQLRTRLAFKTFAATPATSAAS